MLVIGGPIRIDPANHDQAVKAAVTMMKATREEAGCISYTFTAALEERGLFYIFEEWESQDALTAHFGAPHMTVFQGEMGKLGVKEMNVQRYEVSSVGPVRG